MNNKQVLKVMKDLYRADGDCFHRFPNILAKCNDMSVEDLEMALDDLVADGDVMKMPGNNSCPEGYFKYDPQW